MARNLGKISRKQYLGDPINGNRIFIDDIPSYDSSNHGVADFDRAVGGKQKEVVKKPLIMWHCQIKYLFATGSSLYPALAALANAASSSTNRVTGLLKEEDGDGNDDNNDRMMIMMIGGFNMTIMKRGN
ncbi:hypothetical protein L195_g053149 [Trifolium pratense]|uniref:Uncharacterized protein n=1 Tax=Trifolium pratense TaxID=57577 RepID=A0A2K3K8Y6_TRIPR|nr:hypothetical protein L195_g053149 [Trifolium pratense]